MLDPRTFVRSVTHGRARIRHASLKGLTAEEVNSLADMISGFDGITSVEVNPRVGSLLVTWDEEKTNAEALLAAAAFFLPEDEEAPAAEAQAAAVLETDGDAAPAAAAAAPAKSCSCREAVAKTAGGALALAKKGAVKALDLAAPIVAPDEIKGRGGRTRRVTQNRLMLGTFALSLGALALRGVRAHVILGVAYTLFLAVHLAQHRRVL